MNQDTVDMLEHFLEHHAWASAHEHEALLMGMYEPDVQENNEPAAGDETSTSNGSESINTQNEDLLCPFEIKWREVENLADEMNEKYGRLPGPNMVKKALTSLPLVQICQDGANAPMVSRIANKVTREFKYWREHTINFHELEVRKKLHEAFNLLLGQIVMYMTGKAALYASPERTPVSDRISQGPLHGNQRLHVAKSSGNQEGVGT